MLLSAPPSLSARFHSVNEDTERAVRHILYVGGLLLFTDLMAYKKPYQRGGHLALLGGKKKRKRRADACQRQSFQSAMKERCGCKLFDAGWKEFVFGGGKASS